MNLVFDTVALLKKQIIEINTLIEDLERMGMQDRVPHWADVIQWHEHSIRRLKHGLAYD